MTNLTLRELLASPRRGCAPGKADPDVFFGAGTPAESEPGIGGRPSYFEAINICTNRCPDDIRTACDRYATSTGQTHGVWAGKIRTEKTHRAAGFVTPPAAVTKSTSPSADRKRRQRAFDAEVARQYHRGSPDQVIAFVLDVSPRRVMDSRRRQGLTALYGPGGRPVDAERVPA